MTLIEAIGQELLVVLKTQTEMMQKIMERLDDMENELTILSGQLSDISETVEEACACPNGHTKWIIKADPDPPMMPDGLELL